ncbi:MAG: response regulator, partial [Pseudomonadota bacterium]
KAVGFLDDIPTVAGVEIRNANGVQIYREMFETLPREALTTVAPSIDDIDFFPFSSSALYVIRVPVYAKSVDDPFLTGVARNDMREIGFVETMINVSSIKHSLRFGVLFTAIVGLLVTLLASALAYWASGRIIRPIRDVLNGLNSVATGNFSNKLPGANSKELQQLVDGFNIMVDGLRHYRRETLRSREALEHRVEERTHQLYEEKERAETANRTKSEFLARMSHEIRTPMNGVLGMAELLLASKLGGQERRYAQTIQQSGEGLLTIINDILDFSKIEAGHMEIESEPFSVRGVGEDVAAMLATNAQRKGLEFTLDLDPHMPTAVRGDIGRLRQVLTNLVGNAIKFTESGGIVVRVHQNKSLVPARGSHAYRFEVEDTGIGIAKDKQAAIFESFIQEDGSTTRRFGGTGLGLAISTQLVQLMGGQLSVTSEQNQGSCFHFDLTLPAAEYEIDAPAPTDFGDITVLVVDDNAINREVITHQLRAWKIEVACVADAESAIEFLQRPVEPNQRVDIALIDAQMPGMDGLALAAELDRRVRSADKPALILLSSDDTITDDLAKRSGFASNLSKPVLQRELADGLRRALAHARDESTATHSEAMPSIADTTASMTGRVLIVEDNRVNQRVSGAMLGKLGLEFDIAENGEEALKAMSKTTYKLILMDCQMPVMDGFTATAWIRESERDSGDRRIPIVALTANALQGDDTRCFDAGMDDYMSKPFTIAQLETMLEKWLPRVDTSMEQTQHIA